MTIYFDTNILIYAFAKNVDNIHQQEKSINLLEKAIEKNLLIISDISLFEFAFISKKLNEKNDIINQNLEFLSQYLLNSNKNITKRVLEILKDKNLFKKSFDIYHFAFAEYFNAKLYTFDKDFNKLKDISNSEIIVL